MKSKYILVVVITAAALNGCRSVQKAQTSKQSTSEVIEGNSTISGQLTVIDSAGSGKHIVDSKTITDSGYTKTTITKEYFSDEFGLSSDTSDIPTPMRIHHDPHRPYNSERLRYRETTTVEHGDLSRIEEKSLSAEQSAHVKRTDSIGLASVQQQHEVVSDTWISWKVIRDNVAGSWIIWMLIAVVAVYLGWRVFKKVV